MRRFLWYFEQKGKSDLSDDKAGEAQDPSGILGPKRRSKSLDGGSGILGFRAGNAQILVVF